ncbi:MAG TPA: leucine-rich repeat domain-containing protein [Thermoplasmata archaeon]|nr:leucine-rich repeat domain-containing protein [Thermoplasmata archaeon]
MKKKLWVGILIGLIFGIVVVSSLIIIKQPTVTFPDRNLEKAVREAIGKPTGPIRAADLEKLTRLSANGENITELTGLEYCTNLESLDREQPNKRHLRAFQAHQSGEAGAWGQPNR